MKRMKSKKLNSSMIAVALTASIAFGGVGAALLNGGGSALPVHALESNYEIQAPAVQGKTIYVASDVAYGEGAGTEVAPYNIVDLLEHADTMLGGGDTVIVKPGTYNIDRRLLITKSGEFNNYITVKNESSTQKAVLSFYEMAFDGNNRGVQLDGDFWHWYGIDICGAGDNGMYIGGSYNVVENCEFYENRDTGLQLGRKYSPDLTLAHITQWPSYNLIKNCTSYNNYDNETYGENADGFAAKLTIGYGNIFDGCIAYRNSDDGWDLFAKTDSGNIGAVIIYNCVAFENGYLANTQAELNAKFPNYNHAFDEPNTNSYLTRDGDGNGFKLGGSVMEGDVFLYNCQSFNNRMHGITDNSNPGVLSVSNVTAYNNSAGIDDNPNSANFGQIVLSGDGINNDNKCGNINLARQTYSYNLLSRIVSINDGITTVGADEYRGSAEYSYFDLVNGHANKIEECVDASQRAEAYATKGERVDAISASILAQVPSTWGDTANPVYQYNLDGKENITVHKTYRNADGSINMGDMLRIKDYSSLFGDENKIGADLTKNKWEDYPHYSYFNASNAVSAEDATVKAATATLDVNTNINATFQDFDLIVAMQGVSITWETSDPNTISINTNTPVSPSGTRDARAIVYRGSEDKTVKLTATITHTINKEISEKKEFNITVKKDIPTIGEALFEGVEDGRIIIDQFEKRGEPEMTVRNAADYNGKLLKDSVYSVDSKVTYAVDKTAYPAEVHHFTTSVAGVYGITKTVRMGSQTKAFSYNIFVASPTAKVGFVGEPSIIVNQHGYTIGGEVSSATGKLYAYSSTVPVDGITSEKIIADGKGYEFRNDNIRFQFENDNSKPYYIYYVMCNLHGDVTTEVNTVEVKTVDINTVAEFKAMLLENDSSTIYMLKADIDLSGEKNWVADITSKTTSFKGVLNGLGHTISGLNVNVTDKTNEVGAMFYKLEGGTIENVKFENITIKGNEKTGLIATTYGGYLYNIQLHNIYVTGTVRVGGLVGQAMNGDLYVDQVSLVNDAVYEQTTVTEADFDKDIYYVKDGNNYVVAKQFNASATYYIRKIDIWGARSAGIIGFIQASKATDTTSTYITNCYVDAVIGAETQQYVGSIVGSADDRNIKDYLEITQCYSIATLYARTYMGGILGSHNKGTGAIKLYGCAYYGTLYYGQQKTAPSELAVKNCSGIVGRYVPNARADVRRCYTLFADHNTDFDVEGALSLRQVYKTIWISNMNFDETKWEIVVDPNDEYLVLPPFARLKFLGEWN